MSLKFVKVKEIADQIRGVSYKKADASSAPEEGKIPLLRAGNITDIGLVYDNLVYVPREKISGKQLLKEGDVVIAASSGSLDIVGKAAACTTNFEGSFGAFCKVLRPRKGVDKDYFAHFFRTKRYRSTVSDLATGANINNLRNEHLDDLDFPLPEIGRQSEVASMLNKADEIIRDLETFLQALEELQKSIFFKLFGDPIRNGKKWGVVQVKDFVEKFESGKSLVGADEDDVTAPYRVLKISAITSLRYDPTQSKALPVDYDPPDSHIVRKGDLLFSRANTRALIGATAYVYETPANIVLPDKLWRFVFHEEPKADPIYTMCLFQLPRFRHEVGQESDWDK